MKKIFGEDGFKAFMAQHVEKILLGVIVAISLMLIWSGFQNRKGIRDEYDPAALAAKVEQARAHAEQFTWDDFRQERIVKENFQERARDARQEIQIASYHVKHRMLKPPYQPPRTMRTDPEIFPAEQLQVRAGYAAVEKMAALDGMNRDNPFQNLPGGEGYGGRDVGLYGQQNDDPNVRPIPTQMGAGMPVGERSGRYGGGGGEVEGKFFAVVTALIPFRKQLEAYNASLANSVAYDPARDTPNYDNWFLERAEIVPGQEPVWKRLAWKQKMLAEAEKWGMAMTGGLGGLVSPEVQDPFMTMPLPSLQLDPDQLDHLARHEAIEPYSGEMFAGYGEGAYDAAPLAGTNGEGSDEPNVFENPGVTAGYGAEGAMRAGGRGMSDRMMMPPGGERRGMSEMMGGPPGGMRPPRGGEGPGGYSMMSEGSGAYGGVPGQMLDPEYVPEYKMFRYIDMDVIPGRSYQYRLILRVEDPNDPDTRTKVAPPPSTLDRSVKERLVKRDIEANKEKAELMRKLKAAGVEHIYFIDTPPSAPSQVVTVTDGSRLLLGSLSPVETRAAGFARPGEVPKAQALALKFDAKRATNIPSMVEVSPGSIGNFAEREVEVPIWSEGVLKKEKHALHTNVAVLDFDGGQALGVGDLKAPAEMLVLQGGKMSVVRELASADELQRYDFPEASETQGGFGNEPGYGPGREGTPDSLRTGPPRGRRGGEGGYDSRRGGGESDLGGRRGGGSDLGGRRGSRRGSGGR